MTGDATFSLITAHEISLTVFIPSPVAAFMSLFLKVFLWFWLAMALVIVALLLATELTRTGDAFSPGAMLDVYTTFIARNAVSTYERDGRQGLVGYLERMERETGVSSRLFDEQGAELSGMGARTGMQELARRAPGSDGPVRSGDHARGHMIAFPALAGSGGQRYVFVIELGEHAAPPLHVNPWSFVPRVLAVLLTAGLLCYLLARYIVSPVVKLRAVTRQVSGGDLSARVSPLLGTRRDELADMGRDFDAMAAQIESLLSAQRRLLRDISHELRSPLARLSVALDLARKRTGPEAAGYLSRIERESARLNEMIGQLLALSRWEAGEGGARREPLDLAALVREVAEDADFEARGRNRAVSVVECDECETEGTAALLRSAVENVVRNAVRHAPEETVVKVSLRCRGEGEGGHAVLSVRDEGAGVPEEALADIFRPFYRVDDARDREAGGTGLGLAITERAVRLHGGTVAAANVAGGGFVVEIRLPLDGVPAADSPPQKRADTTRGGEHKRLQTGGRGNVV